MLLTVHPDNPNPRHLKTIIECLLNGGVIIYPTDTIYGLGCDIFQHKAIERIARIKQVDPAKAQLSFVCYDLSDLSKYTKSISTPLYRLLKTYLPGPYTSLPGDMVEEYTDPSFMYDRFHKLVDIVVDGGIGGMIPSTIIDCTKDSYEVIREGAGKWEEA